MKSGILFLVLFFLNSIPGYAQFSRYIIQLKNKTGTPYIISNPSAFLGQRAVERRIRYHIPVDETDLPITPRYLDSIRSIPNVTIINYSKWFNRVCIQTNDATALARINAFDFVASSGPVAARPAGNTARRKDLIDIENVFSAPVVSSVQDVTGLYNYGASYDQVHLHNADFLHNYNFRGQGMQLCITDDGFYNYNSLHTFDSVRLNNQVLGTWDFVSNNAVVEDDDTHGMRCFSTIAANVPGSFVGSAPAASYYLYRTEDLFSEYPVEEQNWLAAAERADSLGVDVLSVSLGYTTFSDTTFDYSYTDMNGNNTTIAKGVNMAARKGMMVVAAAGNDGNNAWHYISTPGDADNALTIGAVSVNRVPASFSSYGPNSDGQVKPDVATIGAGAIVANASTGNPESGNGTSYACPIMAGIVTCLWQAFPEVSNMQLMQTVRQAGDQYTSPDNRTGYGIPDVKNAFVSLLQQLHTFSASVDNNCNAVVNLTIKAAAGMSVAVERRLPSDDGYVVMHTENFTGNFTSRTVNYIDPLADFTGGASIHYRIRMSIGADTSFYTDSIALAYANNCTSITERKICSGASTYLSVNVMDGYTYGWQVDTGNGFSNITDNAVYTGSFTNVLVLKNLPSNYYGYVYRCVQTNGAVVIYSTPVTIKFTSQWTGTVSAAWENAANWSCDIVPGAFTDAIVPAGVPNNPVVNSNAVCHSLKVIPGAVVLVNNGFAMNIVGH